MEGHRVNVRVEFIDPHENKNISQQRLAKREGENPK